MTSAFCLDATLSMIRFSKTKNGAPYDEKSCNGKLLKLSMVLTGVAYPYAIFIAFLYYGAIHAGAIFVGTLEGYLGLYAHMLIPALALIDTFISSRPWSIWHSW